MCSCSVVSNSLWPYGLHPTRSHVRGTLQARILEWIAISSSRGSSGSRYWTCVFSISCIGRWILYHWAIWKVLCNNNNKNTLIHWILLFYKFQFFRIIPPVLFFQLYAHPLLHPPSPNLYINQQPVVSSRNFHGFSSMEFF